MGSLKANVKEKGHVDQQRYALAMNSVKNAEVGLRVLELGCDDGTFAYGFAQLDCKEAIDIHSHENIQYVGKNVEDLDYFEEFDVVHAGEVLEHVGNPDKLMKIICRSVKKNGLIMISVPNFKHPQHLRTYTLRSFKKLLKKNNIEGTVYTIKHDLARKKNKIGSTKRQKLLRLLRLITGTGDTERYAIYDGRIKCNVSNEAKKGRNTASLSSSP